MTNYDMIHDDEVVTMDAMNRRALKFMNDPESVSLEEARELFCDVFNVDQSPAIEYFEGRKFVAER